MDPTTTIVLNNKIDWLDVLADRNDLKPASQILEIAEFWPHLVGPLLSAMSRISSLRGYALIVEVASPVIGYELSVISSQIKEKVNYSLRANCIREIRFVSGSFSKNKHSPRPSLSQTERKDVVPDINHLLEGGLEGSFQRLIKAALLRAEQELQDGAVSCRVCGCPVNISLNDVCSGCRFDGSLSIQPTGKEDSV